MEIGQIVHGHVNELLGLNKDISKLRMNICYKCPLYSIKFGGLCNNKLWLNLETGDISTEAKDGYKNGCGCRLNAKTSLSYAQCPIGKW
jgi:hypothetical protein